MYRSWKIVVRRPLSYWGPILFIQSAIRRPLPWRVVGSVWGSDILPTPPSPSDPYVNTKFSLRAKCWVKGQVGRMSWKAFKYYQVDNIESVIVSAVQEMLCMLINASPLHIKNHCLKLYHVHDLNGLICGNQCLYCVHSCEGSEEECSIFHGVKRLEEVN